MESEDLKINTPKKAPVKSPDKKSKVAASDDATDYLVQGATIGNDVLKKAKRIRDVKEDAVIYGVYDNKGKGFMVKVNDFLIDRTKITIKDKSYFFHMLAVMVDAGIPVIQAVKSLAGRSANPHFKRILNTIAYNCDHGARFYEAMSRFEDVFEESEVGIVRSGESTGRLDVMLFRLSEELDSKHDLYLKLKGAATYPVVVFCLLILVAIGMLVWIFPTLLNLLREGGVPEDSLPLATRVLMVVHTGLVEYWWAMLMGIAGIYLVFTMFVRSDYGAVRWDFWKLKFPVIGKLLRQLYVLRFVSMLGLLIESGLPVIRSLKITGSAISNRLYKLKIQEVINEVKEGGKISESLSDVEFLFPQEVPEMLSVGERVASIAKISKKVSRQFKREIDNSIKRMSSLFEPIMIVVVGLFVALLALAIMSPIFNLGNAIS